VNREQISELLGSF